MATSKGAQGFFSKVTFLKSVHSKEKDKAGSALWSKFSLNLATEEVCHPNKIFRPSDIPGTETSLTRVASVSSMIFWDSPHSR